MVLDKLGESLRNTLDKIKNSLFVDEKLVNELVKDIQRSLLQSDVNVKLVFELTKNIKERALKDDVPKNLSKKDYLVKVVYEELVKFLGGEGAKININKKPFYIMLVGLFGSGKTTTSGKLAKYYQKRGYKVGVISTDTWRPAAYEQLKQLADKLGVDFYGIKGEKDPVKIFSTYDDALKKYDIVIIDTAGRDALNDELIEELNKIRSIVKADENLLVISADIGQSAEKQAKAFHDTCGVTGVIITKFDGTAKGGGALTACAVTNSPVKFLGIGEKADALEEFKPEGFVGRILGMGDLEALLEKVNEAISEEDAKDLGKKFLKGEFNLIDLYEQMQAMKKMGPLTKVMELIPGMSGAKIPKELLENQEVKLEKWKYAMHSMTREELEDAEIIDASRADRIAKGSGLGAGEVRELVKQYKQSKKMMKMLKGNDKNMDKMMKQMSGGQVKF
ncbi:MAG: signal recognition particle protein Srp54 [Candidatus Woesearchaeota archaeon]